MTRVAAGGCRRRRRFQQSRPPASAARRNERRRLCNTRQNPTLPRTPPTIHRQGTTPTWLWEEGGARIPQCLSSGSLGRDGLSNKRPTLRCQTKLRARPALLRPTARIAQAKGALRRARAHGTHGAPAINAASAAGTTRALASVTLGPRGHPDKATNCAETPCAELDGRRVQRNRPRHGLRLHALRQIYRRRTRKPWLRSKGLGPHVATHVSQPCQLWQTRQTSGPTRLDGTQKESHALAT